MHEQFGTTAAAIWLSRLGFGCARINGGVELRGSARVIEAALKAGVTHFDTAPSYGGGRSEDVLGTVLDGVKGVTITTKVGIPRPDDEGEAKLSRLAYRLWIKPLVARVPRLKSRILQLANSRPETENARSNMPYRYLRSSWIRREVEDSLKRLKRDHIDIYLIHEPDQFNIDDETFESFNALIREGVIGAFGLGYGGLPRQSPLFGSVLQCRYSDDLSIGPGNQTTIFHGLLRHGWNAGCHKSGVAKSPSQYFKHVLDKHPGSRIIFSASLPWQIKQLTCEL